VARGEHIVELTEQMGTGDQPQGPDGRKLDNPLRSSTGNGCRHQHVGVDDHVQGFGHDRWFGSGTPPADGGQLLRSDQRRVVLVQRTGVGDVALAQLGKELLHVRPDHKTLNCLGDDLSDVDTATIGLAAGRIERFVAELDR
jgi:hypothetical protein